MERFQHHHIKYIPFLAFLALMIFAPGAAQAACTNPAGVEGEQIYNADHNMMQFCNGTAWVAMTGADPSGSGGSGSDTLSGLSCSADQVAQWNGTAWACAAMSGGSGGGVSGQWGLVPSTENKLVASDAAATDYFGHSISVDSDTAVIGAYADDNGGANGGSAYVFVKTGGTWTQQQKLTGSDTVANDWFGWSVAVSGDTAVIGARGDDDAGSEAGSVYVFTRSGTTWSQQQKVNASDAAANDYFGTSVDIDGDTMIVGVPNDDDAGASSGSAYVFTRSGTTWSQQQKLTASDAAVSDSFGRSVSISTDTVVIGANEDDDGGNNSGAAYVFIRSGTTWSQQQKLAASDAASDDYFGWSVAVSGDTALVGAYQDDDGGSSSGSAYVFTRSGTTWSQQAKLVGADTDTSDSFGFGVDIDGDTAVMGARGANLNIGATYVFMRDGTSWSQKTKFTPNDGGSGDYFGAFVGVSGVNVLSSAYNHDLSGPADAGATYIYDLTLGTGGSGGGGGSDTLSGLACTANQVAQWNGSAWACADMVGTDNLGDHTATQDLNLDSNKITATIGNVFTGVAGNQPVVPVGAGGMGNIQAGAAGLAVEGASCGVVGKLSRSADGKLLVCEGATTITDQACTDFNVGALSFASDGTLVVCLGE